ncbi:hypothetical protein EXIGLDRAFT_762212 [Exidia glandulosa HHB12029]|uniref:Uncharacterized protein n=1 Tax=Exidia glandulosa HHB12029 TaxID=1314781 RepID=A0A165MXU0_EXIGL|nr:hypothetical protein EXIGLDRAFT_762212 [Exidia glandulosa HHB12029]
MARPTASPSPSSTTRIPYLHALSISPNTAPSHTRAPSGPLFYDGVFVHAISLAVPARPIDGSPLPTRPIRAVLELVGATQQRFAPAAAVPWLFFLIAAEHDEQQSARFPPRILDCRLAPARERCRAPLHVGRLIHRRGRTYCLLTTSMWHEGGQRAAHAPSLHTLRPSTWDDDDEQSPTAVTDACRQR